jgi:hypothetical protein
VKPKYSEENCPSAILLTTNPHMACPGIKPVPPRWEASDKPPEPWHCHSRYSISRFSQGGGLHTLVKSMRIVGEFVFGVPPEKFLFFGYGILLFTRHRPMTDELVICRK